VAGRWQVEVRDGLDGVDGMFTHLVSNPPYVTDTEWEALETEVKDFEPRMALTGVVPNPDGLVFYRRLAEWGRNKVQPRGWLCMETGWQQAQAVKKLLQEQMTLEGNVWQDISVTKDLAGRDRVVCARRC
jgi:release factor glutamine methyltransferase